MSNKHNGTNSQGVFVPINLNTGNWTFGKYKGKPIADAPTHYIEWVLNNFHIDDGHKEFLHSVYLTLKKKVDRELITTTTLRQLEEMLTYDLTAPNRTFIENTIKQGYEPTQRQLAIINEIRERFPQLSNIPNGLKAVSAQSDNQQHTNKRKKTDMSLCVKYNIDTDTVTKPEKTFTEVDTVLIWMITNLEVLRYIDDMMSLIPNFFKSSSDKWIAERSIEYFHSHKSVPTTDFFISSLNVIDDKPFCKAIALRMKELYGMPRIVDMNRLKGIMNTACRNHSIDHFVKNITIWHGQGRYDTILELICTTTLNENNKSHETNLLRRTNKSTDHSTDDRMVTKGTNSNIINKDIPIPQL